MLYDEILQKIRRELIKSGGTLDLTDEFNEAVIYDDQREVFIPSLILKNNIEVCALIPLSDFDDKTIERIYKFI